eukprot:Rhum_TRINITY_DN8607_c0_g1::Rhum_TRINITY_DN8607_c0_g1_i1::g.28959::m.28959
MLHLSPTHSNADCTKMKKKTVLSAFFCVCAFMSSTLLFAGSWKVVEALDFETATIAVWHFAGLPACCVVLLVCASNLLRWHGEERDEPMRCQVGFLLLLMVMSSTSFALIVAKDFDVLVVTRQGLEASAAPGWASINCTEEGVDVKTDRFTYFALAAKDWRVASENASIVQRVGKSKTNKHGKVWGVAPI